MKRLLTLMLVFALASVASATLNISVNGDRWPVDYQYIVEPGDYLILDIWTDATIGPGLNECYWELVCDVTLGSIFGGTILDFPPHPDLLIYIDDDAVNNGDFQVPDGTNGVWGCIFSFGGMIPAGRDIYMDIEYHCEDQGDVAILLYKVNNDLTLGPLFDSVMVHQLPEPATLLLLGFGGLFLRRRK